MKTVDFLFFFYFCGSYSYMCTESRNQEQSQKNKNIKKLFYIWNWLYDGRVQDVVLFTHSHEGLEGRKIDDIMASFVILKRISLS